LIGRWPGENREYENTVISNVTLLKDAFITNNGPLFTFSEKYDIVFLRNDGKVVKGNNVGSEDNHIFERSTQEIGTWAISNNEIVLTLDNEKVYLKVVNENGTYFIENANKLGVGFVINDTFYTGSDVDTFISNEIED